MHLGHVQVAAGCFQIRMAEQELYRAQVRAGFQQVRREAMSNRVRVDTFLEPGPLRSVFDCVEDALGAHRHIGGMSAASSGKQIGLGLGVHSTPVVAKLFEQLRAEHHIAILIPFLHGCG